MIAWRALSEELMRWQADGLSFPFWWRDDDAVADTNDLRKLAHIASDAGLAVHIAVIPAHAERGLADFLSSTPQVIPLIHGWAHENHAPPDQKKAEFGAHRPLDQLVADAERGFGKLPGLFGSRLQPMFVPPWNRISDALIPELPTLGYNYLSTATPRAQHYAADGLEQINTHIDPIDWKGTRSLIDEDLLIARITTLLRERRIGDTDNSEPLGLLTHHLVHDPAIWSFCAKLTDTFMSGPAQAWRVGQGDHQ